LGLILSACDIFTATYSPSADHDSTPPEIPASLASPAVLLFSKTNGYRHESIETGVEEFKKLAKKNGWSVFHTENGATFNAQDLAKFDATVWLSVSGPVLSTEQQNSFKAWLESGKGFVGIHGTGGDPYYKDQWTWFVEELIGAQFIGHPILQHIQEATVVVEDKSHPATKNLPDRWTHSDEWYSFDRSVRGHGFNVLASIDESTYNPRVVIKSLAMGDDHPIMWHSCQKAGRVFYTALGHTEETYRNKSFQASIEGATSWALDRNSEHCKTPTIASIPH